jgi:hypothetical protein
MKRALLSLLSLVAAATLAGCALFYPNIGSTESPSDPMDPSPTPTVSESPTQEPSESPTPEVVKQEAKPRLLDYFIDQGSGTLILIGEVINFAEDGGECIITFYSGNTPIIQERVPAEHNITTTQCFPLNIGLSRLPKGIGSVTVSYESEKYAGDSARFEVIIP